MTVDRLPANALRGHMAKVPLFANSPPVSGLAGQRRACRPSSSAQMQYLCTEDDGPDTFRFLKNAGSSTHAAVRASIQTNTYDLSPAHAGYLSNTAMLAIASNSLSTSG